MGVHSNKNTFNPFNPSLLNQKYLETCKEIWENTTNNNVIPIFTLKHLSLFTGIEYKTLSTYTHRKVSPYKKVILETSKKRRKLLIPWKELVVIQNWIKKNILDNVASSDNSTAYDRNCSIVKNAQVHIDAQWLIKLDLQNFFTSIHENDIYKIFHELGYSKLFSLELARLCTYQDEQYRFYAEDYPYRVSKAYLPQGSSTSPKLANLFARKIDEEINLMLDTEFSQFNLNFTRYSDDIIISGDLRNINNCKKIIIKAKTIINNHKLRINNKKTKIFSPTSIKKITGINIIDGELRPSKKIVNYIQTSLYYIEKYTLEEHISKVGNSNYDTETYKEHLLGKIFFVKFVNNTIGDKLLNEYNRICL